MTIETITERYGFDFKDFKAYVLENTPYKPRFGGIFNIPDDEADKIANEYKAIIEEQARLLAQKQAEEEEAERQYEEELAKVLPGILITSGYSFEGYKITKYSGYISGDDVVQINRESVAYGGVGEELTDALVKIRIQALKELKEAAYHLGCNAVIGVDFDYITFEPETASSMGGTVYYPYVVCVTANGTAVVIEKE